MFQFDSKSFHYVKFGTSIGIAVLTERVPNETFVLFVMFEMWMRVPELIERVPMKLFLNLCKFWSVVVKCALSYSKCGFELRC